MCQEKNLHNLNLNHFQNHKNTQWPYIKHLEIQIHLKIHFTLKTVHLHVSKGSKCIHIISDFSWTVNGGELINLRTWPQRSKDQERKQSPIFLLLIATVLDSYFLFFVSFLHKVCTCPRKKEMKCCIRYLARQEPGSMDGDSN